MKLASVLLTAIAVTLLAGLPGFSAMGPVPEETKKLREILDAPPPDAKEHSKTALAKIYLERGRAAGTLGDFNREMQELTAGIEAVGAKDPNAYEFYDRLAQLNIDRGDYVSSRATREAALQVANNPGRRFFQLNHLSSISSVLRDRENAKAYLSQADGLMSSVRRNNLEWGRFGDYWQAALNEVKGNYNFSFGYLSEAEASYRTCATAMRTYLGKNPDASEAAYYYLPQCLSRWVELAALVGHLREAGAYVNDVRDAAKAYAQGQRRVLYETRPNRSIARVYLEQGLLDEAQALLESTISQSRQAQRGEASLQVADARVLLATMEMARGNWLKADEHFRARREGLRAHKDQAEERGGENMPEWGYALLRLGKTQEAMAILDADLRLRQGRYDEQSIHLWESRAFHALGLGAAGDKENAVRALAVALPKILELRRGQGSTENGWLTTIRLGWILDGYVGLLAELYKAGVRPAGIEPYAEAFRMADLARGSRVQRALSAAIIRASINDPELVVVLRKAQDLDYQVKATSEALTAMLSAQTQAAQTQPAQAQAAKNYAAREKLIEKARADLERLRQENEKAQAELKRKMPDYSNLLDAKPVTLADAQKLLNPHEALIAIYTTQKQTLVWAFPREGHAAFHVADLPSVAVAELVAKLRKALDPSAADLARMAAFDFKSAHELYQKLLAPVEAAWKNAKVLIVVPHGSLSELPFSVLVKSDFQPQKSGLLFADHGAAPWLIKGAAISYLPSLAALASLRSAATQPAERPFIGFGDPAFGSAPSAATELAARGIVRRNAKGDTVPQNPSSQLEWLQPLPDTAQEVRDIAKILRSDETRDVYLGKRATEQTVKSIDLTSYRVVMFATHGLVPGELPDLTQPALALSNPTITGEKEDGLLTLAEILGIKLRADWVVLSACNTASPDGQAAEAVSGLGRAFFFAGAKALLVSHWPVETVSAKLLTTELFRRQAANPNLARAQALREASLAVMQQTAKGARGPSYSYAHPMFWAPFVVVGDGG